MTMRTWCWMLGIGVSMLLAQAVSAATMRPLTDSQLDEVYAGGLDIQVDLDLDVSASKPDAVLMTGEGSSAALQNFVDRGMALARVSGTRNDASFDPTGTYTPNLQNLTTNNMNITGNALQNASSMLNIFAMEGDVAVGVNINVMVNPTNSAFNITQMNMNWATMDLSSAFSTLSSTSDN